MKRNRGASTHWVWMTEQLKEFYGRWAGELDWIENPPKSMSRKWRGRDEFEEEAPARGARAVAIREALPHILYVIRLLDPEWRVEMATLVRPKKPPAAGPPLGWTEAAMSVLRRATDYLSMTEIVDEIAEAHDEVDLSTEGARTKAALALNGSLLMGYRHLLAEDPKGGRWALISRVPLFHAD